MKREFPVLLLHSSGMTSRQWRRLALKLEASGPVLCPDLLGYGASGEWPEGKPFHFAEDIEALEALIGNQPVHLVGHSYGGLLGLKLALARPAQILSLAVYEPVAFRALDDERDADALALLEPLMRGYRPGAVGAKEAWVSEFVDWWGGAGAWGRLPPETRAGFLAGGWKCSQEAISLMEDCDRLEAYRAIRTPTLLLGGALSPLPARRVLERLAAVIPRAVYQRFEGAGHMGPLTHPAPVTGAILAQLDGLRTSIRDCSKVPSTP